MSAADFIETYDDLRRFLDFMSDEKNEWQGIPVPVTGQPLRLHDRHPMAAFFRGLDEDVRAELAEPAEWTCSVDDVDEEERVVNEWFCARLNVQVLVVDRGGRRSALKVKRAPDGSMDRLELWLMTIGASDAWDLDAEARAMEKLCGLLTERQRRHYLLTGAFLETSQRSGLTYVFRRSRPTIAMTPRWHWARPQRDSMRCLAVLCLHPVGYYERSWAGCMVPSDDVIAHLLAMRADEAYFWRCANQHEPWRPEAGI